MQVTQVPQEYLEMLESAVLAAEWWLADIEVARRKDIRGERKREVNAAATQIRARRLEGAR